jgi:cystathionine beta-lyase
MAKDVSNKDTDIVDGGRRKEWRSRLVNVPVHRGSTILFDTMEELDASRPDLGEYSYGLQGTPTHWALSEALNGLEPGAGGTALYPSGLAAITASLLAVLKAGDELLVVDSAYGPTRSFCDAALKRFGVTTLYYDPALSADEVTGLFADRTAAILLESPGSMTMEVQDVPGICAAARKRGIVTLLDNTWATPLLFPALAAGVDISILALTKFVGGHSDLLMGSATATPALWKKLQRSSWDLGMTASPDDTWLAARGLRTLAVRMRHHEQSALAVANHLRGHQRVGRILHPAFDDCPGHEFWKRDFTGSSSLFSFEYLGSTEERNAFVNGLRNFGIGYSWGGFESLATAVDPTRTVSQTRAPNLVRLHIGLEDVGDLIGDLQQAFAKAGD